MPTGQDQWAAPNGSKLALFGSSHQQACLLFESAESAAYKIAVWRHMIAHGIGHPMLCSCQIMQAAPLQTSKVCCTFTVQADLCCVPGPAEV